MEKIRVLQLGDHNYYNELDLPQFIKWSFGDDLEDGFIGHFELVIVIGKIETSQISLLEKYVQCYRLLVVKNDSCNTLSEVEDLYKKNCAKELGLSELETFLQEESRYFFDGGYGEKFRHVNLAINSLFKGDVQWNGNYCVQLEGEFGNQFKQILYWRNNIPIEMEQTLDIWLEYETSGTVELELEIRLFRKGMAAEELHRWSFDEQSLQGIIPLYSEEEGSLFFSLRAKGEGTLKVIALHDRYSRREHGYFFPGGKRHVTSNKEELFSYFEPGDRRPPLNVYFAGYKTQQSFEGLYMMRRLGCPFALLSDSRLEGGNFYIGNQEYEDMVRSVLKKYMNELGFSEEEVIFSGLSMGSYGAFYYGCDFKPHTVLVGKPLINLGNIALNEITIRPEGFKTSVDVLRYMEKNLSMEAVDHLNQRFWNKFTNTTFDNTKFIISYMIEDDYDADAYQNLISNVKSAGIQIFGKGLHGRHNDETGGIVSWFKSQYIKIIQDDFGRR